MMRTRKGDNAINTSDDDNVVDKKVDAPPPNVIKGDKSHTEWGYSLLGDSQFWGKVKINCKNPTGKFVMADLKQHNDAKSLYLSMQGYVFDVTEFSTTHPGGDAILGGAEQDASEIFELHHQEFVGNMLGNFCIGKMYPSEEKPQNEELKKPTDVKKTDWGTPLHGTDSFWSSVDIKCKDDSGHFTISDLQEHSNKESLYLSMRGYVIDVTKFLSTHPGGEAILEGAKEDATDLFESHHQSFVGGMLGNFCIGKLYPK